MEPKIKLIVDQLLAGTSKKKLNWVQTERKTEYRLAMEKGAITVDKWQGTDEDTGDEFQMADICFLNSTGESVDRYAFGSAENEYRELVRLHDAVRRNVMKVDETIDALIAELKVKTS